MTIHVAPGLTARDRREAVHAGPRAVTSRHGQATLLSRAGFEDVAQVDVSASYTRTLGAWIEATDENFDALAALEPPGDLAQRQTDRRVHLAAAKRGLLRRSLLVGHKPVRAS